MPNAFYAKKKVFICHFGEVCICCANQSIATPHQCCMYQRCSQLRYQSNKSTHTLQVKQKAPIQHHNFLETTTTTMKKMRSTEAEKV